MPPNPKRLNALQLKTLTLLQELAKHPLFVEPAEAGEGVVVNMLPDAHGDHFHIGARVVMGKDATGLRNPAVWKALDRKGFVAQGADGRYVVTPAGLDYPTGLRDKILHGSDH